MPLEGVPQPVKTYAILLRNSQPEKVHGKPGQAIPLPPTRKIIPSVRPHLLRKPATSILTLIIRSVIILTIGNITTDCRKYHKKIKVRGAEK